MSEDEQNATGHSGNPSHSHFSVPLSYLGLLDMQSAARAHSLAVWH